MYSQLLNLTKRPEVRYLQVEWRIARPGTTRIDPLFGFSVFAEASRVRGKRRTMDSENNGFEITFDHKLPAKTVAGVLTALANYYRACGGVGLEVEFDFEETSIPERVRVRA